MARRQFAATLVMSEALGLRNSFHRGSGRETRLSGGRRRRDAFERLAGAVQEIEFICNLHEQASAIAAENYSKATNHLGVALVTTGPGGTNAVTGCRRRVARFHAVPVYFGPGEAC